MSFKGFSKMDLASVSGLNSMLSGSKVVDFLSFYSIFSFHVLMCRVLVAFRDLIRET